MTGVQDWRVLPLSTTELDMAQRLAHRHARVLNEFGYLTAESPRCSTPGRPAG